MRDSGAYAGLPEVLKHTFTQHEYQFMPDSQKARLLQTETEPEQDTWD